jgi:hypothetical protein
VITSFDIALCHCREVKMLRINHIIKLNLFSQFNIRVFACTCKWNYTLFQKVISILWFLFTGMEWPMAYLAERRMRESLNSKKCSVRYVHLFIITSNKLQKTLKQKEGLESFFFYSKTYKTKHSIPLNY